MDAVNSGLHLIRFAYVSRVSFGFASERFHFGDGFIQPIQLHIGDGDISAGFCQTQGDALTNSACGASDDGNFTFH
jgi:hypothetical protein